MARVPPCPSPRSQAGALPPPLSHIPRTQPQTPMRKLGARAPIFTPGAQSACAPTARAPPLPKLSASTRRRGPRLGTLYQCQGRASTSTHARTPTHARARTHALRPSPQRAYLVAQLLPRAQSDRQAFCCASLGSSSRTAAVLATLLSFFRLFMLRLRGPFCHTSSTHFRLFPN